MLGAMQDFPLRIMRILDHAQREHGGREIVAARADGITYRTNWSAVAHDARRLAQALERRGVGPTERVGTMASSTPTTIGCSTTSSNISSTTRKTACCSTIARLRPSLSA